MGRRIGHRVLNPKCVKKSIRLTATDAGKVKNEAEKQHISENKLIENAIAFYLNIVDK